MISKRAKYALNALLHLTRRQGEGPIQIAQIAQQENIPQKFLEGILLDLRNGGILASRRGREGGYYLLRKPQEVDLAQVMRLMDGPIALLPCVSENYYERCEECHDEQTCAIRRTFLEIRENTYEILKGTTLARLAESEAELTGKPG